MLATTARASRAPRHQGAAASGVAEGESEGEGDCEGVGEGVVMLADGNGEFTKALGLEMDGSNFGLGTRSQRYAMVIDNGVVSLLNIETAPGTIEQSGAEAVLAAL